MSEPRVFDPLMLDRHPAVQLVVGQTESGKSSYINLILSMWPGYSLAIDDVCTEPPEPRHCAHWATTWCRPDDLEDAEPSIVPPSISLIVTDESTLCTSQSKKKFRAVREAIYRGQHTGTWKRSLVLGTQRVVEIPYGAWSQAQRVVMFRTTVEHDLARLAELRGMTPAALAMLPELPQGYPVIWDRVEGLRYPWIPEWQAHR